MVRPLVSADTHAGDPYNDRLHALVARIASGDRAAYRTVYAFLAMQVWRDPNLARDLHARRRP
jgi:hypothetical protein